MSEASGEELRLATREAVTNLVISIADFHRVTNALAASVGMLRTMVLASHQRDAAALEAASAEIERRLAEYDAASKQHLDGLVSILRRMAGEDG